MWAFTPINLGRVLKQVENNLKAIILKIIHKWKIISQLLVFQGVDVAANLVRLYNSQRNSKKNTRAKELKFMTVHLEKGETNIASLEGLSGESSPF